MGMKTSLKYDSTKSGKANFFQPQSLSRLQNPSELTVSESNNRVRPVLRSSNLHFSEKSKNFWIQMFVCCANVGRPKGPLVQAFLLDT